MLSVEVFKKKHGLPAGLSGQTSNKEISLQVHKKFFRITEIIGTFDILKKIFFFFLNQKLNGGLFYQSKTFAVSINCGGMYSL